MKTIRLLESQANRLFELTTIGDDSPNNVQEYPDSTVSATANFADADGNTQYGKPKTTDKVQDDLTNMGFMGHGRYKW